MNPLYRFSEIDNQKIFVEFSFSSFKINYFLKQLKKYPPGRLPKFTTKEQLKSFLNQRIVPVLLLEHEVEKRHLQNDEEVKKQIKDFQESLMETNIYRLQVIDKISITDEKIKKYFNEHRDDFKNAPMRDVQEIYVASKTTAELIVSAAKKGNNFTTLFDKYNEKKALSKNRGKLGFISKGRAGIGKPAFKIKVGEISDPIKIGKGYSIIKVLSEKPETLKTFDESKRIVSARLRRTLNTDREKEWLNRLRKKVSVAIYEKNLDQACKNVYGADVRAEK